MNDRRRPPRRGRGPRPQHRPPSDSMPDQSPYREDAFAPTAEGDVAPDYGGANSAGSTTDGANVEGGAAGGGTPGPGAGDDAPSAAPSGISDSAGVGTAASVNNAGGNQTPHQQPTRDGRQQFGNGRRRRGRGRQGPHQDRGNSGPPAPIVPDGTALGWFDSAREGGFIRSPADSYLPVASDPYVPPYLVRQFALRRGDLIDATTGRDHRGRIAVAEIRKVNDAEPALAARRPDFSSLIASYPDRKLTLETGRPARGGPELTRRAIDLIAPIGYG